MPKKEYILLYTSKFKKDFSSLSSLVQEQIIVACNEINKTPFEGIKKLQGLKLGIFRKRVGDYRIRYDVFDNEIVLYSVKHRKDIYKK